jgi:pimeloyl-ACP methyl ester carboxylesterase
MKWLAAAVMFLAGCALPANAIEKNVEVAGQTIHYSDTGTGRVIILLHGLGMDHHHWDSNIPPLSTKFRVLAPDQIGFGDSSKPLINYSTYTLVEFLRGFMDKLGIDKTILVGNSLGGRVALNFALQSPERVARLVLVDASGIKLPEMSARAKSVTFNPATMEEMRNLFLVLTSDSPLITTEYVRQNWENRLRRGDAYTIEHILTEKYTPVDDRLRDLRVPTLIIWGRGDLIRPCCEMANAFKTGIPSSTLVVLDAGHTPHFEVPELFNRTLMNWLKSGQP